MIRFSLMFYALVAVTLSLHQVAMAGTGAFVNGCIAVPQSRASEPIFGVTFTTGGPTTSCMNSEGNYRTSMTVEQPGITCVYLGYVEAKSSKACFFKTATWDLTYKDTRGTSGGTTGTVWSPAVGPFGNTVSLRGYSPRTRVCANSTAVCDEQVWGPDVQWKKGTQGPIFIIFQPFAD